MRKLFICLELCALGIMHTTATVPTAAEIAHITKPILGHRGSVWGVENTEEAFLNGVKAGYSLLETDVKVTKDGVYICFHDDNLERLGGDAMASIVIAETNWADLKDIEFKQRRQGRDYRGKICTLERFLEICKANNVTPVIDLKKTVGFNQTDYSKAAALVKYVEATFGSNVVFLSSQHNCLKEIRKTSANVTLQRSSTTNGVMADDVLSFCKTNKVNFGVNLDAGSQYQTMSVDHVKKAHGAGLKIGVYTVKNYADLKKYQDMGVDNITFEPNIYITADPTSLTFENTILTTTARKEFKITTINLHEDITNIRSNNPDFIVSHTTLPQAGGTITITHKPTQLDKDSATIYFYSSDGIKRVKVYGTGAEQPLPFTEGWNYSETSGQTADWASDFTTLRNLDFGAGKLYVVADGNKIIIVNAQTGAKMYTMNNEGVAGGAVALVDCKYVSGKIVACNIATSTSPLKVYVWDEDYAKPRVLLQTSNIGGFTRLGDCLGIRGNLTNGQLLFAGSAPDGSSSIVYYTITDGVCATAPTEVKAIKDANGNAVKLGYSPRVVASGDAAWWCNGSSVTPSYVNASVVNPAASTVNKAAVGDNIYGNALKSFSFKNVSYIATTAYDADAKQSLMHGHLALVKKGTTWNTSTLIGTYPSVGLGSTQNESYSTSLAIAATGTTGLEMWVIVHNQGVAYYKHGTPKTWNPTLTGTPPSPPTTTDLQQSQVPVFTYDIEGDILIIEGVEAAQTTLYTLHGQKVCETQKSNTILVDIPSGLYIIKVTDLAGITYTDKIVLK